MISSQTQFLSNDIIPLILSVVIGMIIGVEREICRKPAGMRTCALVCLGSTLFTLLSQTNFGTPADPTRIASNILTGIGFLGAGTILVHRDKVIGLTTAAVVWFTSSLGMAIGFRQYAVAIVGTALCLAVLVLFRFAESFVIKYKHKERREL